MCDMKPSLYALLLAFLLSLGSASLPLDVSTPSGYTQLRSWGKSSLYRIETTSYENTPLLIHLTGSRYGERCVQSLLIFHDHVMCTSTSAEGSCRQCFLSGQDLRAFSAEGLAFSPSAAFPCRGVRCFWMGGLGKEWWPDGPIYLGGVGAILPQEKIFSVI